MAQVRYSVQRWFLLGIFMVNLFYHKLHQVVMVEISCWLVCRHHLKEKECFCWTEVHRGPLAFLTSRSVITPIHLAQQEFHSKSIKMFYLYCTCCVCRTALRWHSFPLVCTKIIKKKIIFTLIYLLSSL